MPLSDLSTQNTIFVLNGIGEITDWGRTDPPFTIEYIDPIGALQRGLGKRGVKFNRLAPGIRVTLNLIPGSPQATAIQAQANSSAEASGAYSSIDGLEAAEFTEGAYVQGRSLARGGPGMNDATFVIEANQGVIL